MNSVPSTRIGSNPPAALAAARRRSRRQVGQVAGAELAGQQADAVEHDARRAAAVDDVLEGRLARLPPALEEAGQGVARQAGHLDGDEHHQQVVGRRHQHHAERARRAAARRSRPESSRSGMPVSSVSQMTRAVKASRKSRRKTVKCRRRACRRRVGWPVDSARRAWSTAASHCQAPTARATQVHDAGPAPAEVQRDRSARTTGAAAAAATMRQPHRTQLRAGSQLSRSLREARSAAWRATGSWSQARLADSAALAGSPLAELQRRYRCTAVASDVRPARRRSAPSSSAAAARQHAQQHRQHHQRRSRQHLAQVMSG